MAELLAARPAVPRAAWRARCFAASAFLFFLAKGVAWLAVAWLAARAVD